MANTTEELDRTVLALIATVTSRSVRYRLHEIHERLAELLRASERERQECQAAH
jgi:hypothetical protein